ncbi:MAG: NAD-dependent epimerase/dehydratase family protein, partial [Acidimicrobiales bacterium]
GAGESVSVNELHRMACDVSGSDIPVWHGPARAGEMRAVLVDPARAARAGWRAEVGLPEGLARTWAYFQALGAPGLPGR